MRIVIVTGLSGAGKSTALRALEDYGFYCVDNLPLPMLERLVEQLISDGVDELAIAVDARQESHIAEVPDAIDKLRTGGHDVDLLYLDATDHQLQTRFNATRRRHPLSSRDITAGIARDRQVLSELRNIQDINIIDTTELNVHELKARIQDKYGGQYDAKHGGNRLSVVLMSFGFKHGAPSEANLLFDVRFLRNPHFQEHLRALDGREPRVRTFVMEQDQAKEMTGRIDDLLRFTLPLFQEERKLYLTVGVGCTGGKHRSVAIVEALSERIKGDWDVVIKHRDLESNH